MWANQSILIFYGYEVREEHFDNLSMNIKHVIIFHIPVLIGALIPYGGIILPS